MGSVVNLLGNSAPFCCSRWLCRPTLSAASAQRVRSSGAFISLHASSNISLSLAGGAATECLLLQPMMSNAASVEQINLSFTIFSYFIALPSAIMNYHRRAAFGVSPGAPCSASIPLNSRSNRVPISHTRTAGIIQSTSITRYISNRLSKKEVHGAAVCPTGPAPNKTTPINISSRTMKKELPCSLR